jgi:hypothetical protein
MGRRWEPLLRLELPQVGLGQLDDLGSATGQDRPGRVQGESLDLAVVQLGRQGELVPGGADVDQGGAVVGEGGAEGVLELLGPLDPFGVQADGAGDADEIGVVKVGAGPAGPGRPAGDRVSRGGSGARSVRARRGSGSGRRSRSA